VLSSVPLGYRTAIAAQGVSASTQASAASSSAAAPAAAFKAAAAAGGATRAAAWLSGDAAICWKMGSTDEPVLLLTGTVLADPICSRKARDVSRQKSCQSAEVV
jgi:hypothetical protein